MKEKPLFVDKLKPKKITDLIGHKSHINRIIKWLKNWKNEKYKAVLLYGPAGIGKTSCAHVIPKEMKYEIIEKNASDKRSAADVKELIEIVETLPVFLFGKYKSGRLLIMDEVDGLSSGDKGGVGEIKNLIEKTCIPIICIANDIEGTKLSSLKKVCLKLEFKPPGPNDLIPAISKLFPKLSKKQVEKAVKSSKGDIRHLLNMLQRGCLFSGKTLVKKGISATDSVELLINEKKLTDEQASDLFFANYDLTPFYIHELYPQYIKSLKPMVNAADNLSIVETLQEQITKNQDWGVMKYIEHLTVNVARQKGEFRGHYMPFPQSLSKLSKLNKYKRILFRIRDRTCALDHTILNYETIDFIYQLKLKKLVDETATKEDLKFIAELFDEKDDIYDFIEHFCDKKVPTAMKRKITAVYKEKPTKDIKNAIKKKTKAKKPKVKKATAKKTIKIPKKTKNPINASKTNKKMKKSED